ncbi:hypothetical protein DPMN_027991 [Dreissena polymorpha]|uniref:Uncharacterized protein n=1 Tax=Dreissena polymorpha TaxID=45954 RepID=A0A9D4REW8_DREPO|nr:hypothetical protein DPMN_027991 [Dreissena polymorpha]
MDRGQPNRLVSNDECVYPRLRMTLFDKHNFQIDPRSVVENAFVCCLVYLLPKQNETHLMDDFMRSVI